MVDANVRLADVDWEEQDHRETDGAERRDEVGEDRERVAGRVHDRMDGGDRREAVLADAAAWLRRLDAGEVV